MRLFLITVALFLGACQAEIKSEEKDLSYSFTENNCPTGKVTYSDTTDYCNALKDDARNNYCARQSRYEKFKNECPGQQW